MLAGKRILLGITGGIAAYKSLTLIRLFRKAGADVQVVCTPSALDFVTPLSLSTLSENPVHSEFVTDRQRGTWANHVALGRWPHLFVMAPLTANTLSQMSSGGCDNLLLATYLSTTAPVMVALAMDLEMYAHPTVKANLDTLRQRGVRVIDARYGHLASGLEGQGRMAEPEEIFAEVVEALIPKGPLAGKRIIVTAGPTFEPIDPVRFIGNHSSGKMGFAVADELSQRGAIVHIIAGPTTEKLNNEAAERVNVMTAAEMHDRVAERFPKCDALIMAAAVADFKPSRIGDQKIKKEKDRFDTIELTPTVDVLKAMGLLKSSQLMVGFALETDDGMEAARGKLRAKNLDMVVLNSLADAGAGFGGDTNKVTFVWGDRMVQYPLKTKAQVAIDLCNELEKMF